MLVAVVVADAATAVAVAFRAVDVVPVALQSQVAPVALARWALVPARTAGVLLLMVAWLQAAVRLLTVASLTMQVEQWLQVLADTLVLSRSLVKLARSPSVYGFQIR